MEEKKKSPYSFWSNVRYALSHMWKWQKGAAVLLFLCAPFTVAAPFLGIYLSKAVVDAVTKGQSPRQVLFTVLWVSLALFLCVAIEKALRAGREKFVMLHDFMTQNEALGKRVKSDYETMASPDGMNRMSKALEHMGSDDSGARQIGTVLSDLLADCMGTVFYAAILFTLSPWILLAVAATTLSGFFFLNRTANWRYRNKDHWKGSDRKLDYLRQSSGDFARAKDIRLYGMADWLSQIFQSTLTKRLAWNRKEQINLFGSDLMQSVLSLAREGIAYGFLMYLMFARNLPVSDFVLYFGVIAGFTGWLNGFVKHFGSLNKIQLAYSEIREFLDFPDKANHGPGAPLPIGTVSIAFEHVSYRYPGTEKDTIKDLSFVIEQGEKLAIVGVNGAGKTTLVKLMCGLFEPTSGKILVNGVGINDYNREEYYTLFSAVFQEMFLMPMSIACNVAGSLSGQEDRERVERSLTLAGLSDKVAAYRDGMDTKLVKGAFDDAVELSGGETQKLALARALYKNGKALILDEPTAALDPIAESRIYEEYNRMAAGRTCVFISHRLASTRFCDQILFLEDGKIAEYGSHEALMKKKGKYYEMFQVQSHYYKEEACRI